MGAGDRSRAVALVTLTAMRYSDTAAARSRDHGNLLWMSAIGVMLVLVLITVGWLLVTIDAKGFVMVIPALVPLAIVISGALWLDRWEPEPRALLMLALLYGAGASVLGTLWGTNVMIDVARDLRGASHVADAWEVAFRGPIVEELAKGSGLLLILAIARREFEGPVDGFIYAAFIGAGFAFTENVLYFANAGDTGLELVWTLVVRGILSPFAHALFTGLAGMALGWGSRYGGRMRLFLAWLVGTVLAILAHAFWNSGSLLLLPLLGIDPSNSFAWIGFYLVAQVPVFLTIGWTLFRFRDHDRQTTRARLEEYREKGWFTTSEVQMITDWDARVRALRWARATSPEKHRAMRDFIEDATHLAYAREHARVNKHDPNRRTTERALLDRVQEDRAALSACGE